VGPTVFKTITPKLMYCTHTHVHAYQCKKKELNCIWTTAKGWFNQNWVASTQFSIFPPYILHIQHLSLSKSLVYPITWEWMLHKVQQCNCAQMAPTCNKQMKLSMLIHFCMDIRSWIAEAPLLVCNDFTNCNCLHTAKDSCLRILLKHVYTS